MAKIDVNFNNKDYYIDEDSFSTATASLRSHLSTVMNGSGATVNLGGTSYNINSTKLSTERNTFVSHLSTIAGSGHKVVVGGVEYGVASDKVSGAISELETVLDNLNTPVSKNIVLEVKKMTSNTYANSTTYNNEEFILLDIDMPVDGTVYVTYEGLTKPVTEKETTFTGCIGKVFFGTFNGKSDSVETPSSGVLTIEGDYINFSVGSYNLEKGSLAYCSCITDIYDWGNVTTIQPYALAGCSGLTSITFPNGITTIEHDALSNCLGLTSITIPSSVTTIEMRAFQGCSGLTSVTIPSSVTTIESNAFAACSNLTSVYFENTVGWVSKSDASSSYGIPVDVTDPVQNAENLTTYSSSVDNVWQRA